MQRSIRAKKHLDDDDGTVKNRGQVEGGDGHPKFVHVAGFTLKKVQEQSVLQAGTKLHFDLLHR